MSCVIFSQLNTFSVNKAIIHEDLAKANGLKVGDKLKLKGNPEDADNVNKSTEVKKFKNYIK